ncbi:MAG: hypothetical protein TYPL_1700 [Candidatus Tyloplasma litorale]|nr:MAG: hypothetical protein TYPL_1700 [Mycoplasmatales bacterium]
MSDKKEVKRYCFETEYIPNTYLKVYYHGKNIILYEIEYDNLRSARMQFNEEKINITNGIYFLFIDDIENFENNNFYVGQTTKGFDRFNNHQFIEGIDENERSKIKILFFDFSEFLESPSRNILDYIEKEFINIVNQDSFYKIANATNINSNENNYFLQNREIQYAEEVLKNINELLPIFKINFSKKEDNNSIDSHLNESEENIFYIQDKKNNRYNATIIKDGDFWILKKDSKVNCLNFLEKLNDLSENEFKNNISNINWFKNNKNKINIENNKLIEDIKWNSPSIITCFVKGMKASNGWTNMKNKYGKTPNDIYRT